MQTLLFAVSLGWASPPPATINPDADLGPTPPAAVAHGEVVFDSRLPAEIRVDGQVLAELHAPGRLAVDLPVGPHEVVVLTNGVARAIAVDVPRSGSAVVMVGRTGLTTGARGAQALADGELAPVELRVPGARDVLVQIGGTRWRVHGGGSRGIEVPAGVHTMSVRSGDGTVIWASGTLELRGGGPVVLQLAEGRIPEVSGAGTAFHPGI